MALSTLHRDDDVAVAIVVFLRALKTKVQKHHKQSVRRRQFVCHKPETGSDSKATRCAKMPTDDGGGNSLTVSNYTPATLRENLNWKCYGLNEVKVNNLLN